MVFGFFKRKKEKELPKIEGPKIPEISPKTEESIGIENIKAKIDLMLTQIESLRAKYETMNTKIAEIERMIREIYEMAKSS